MSLEFACPYCEEISKVPDSYAGKRGKCPKCGKVIEVPDPNAADDGGEASGPSAGEAFGEPVGGGGSTKACPYCGESIKRVAKKCKFCGEFLDRRLKGGGGRRGGGRKPDNHLVYAILVTVLCCWPLGLVSIIYAAQVDSKWNQGNHAGARRASQSAKTWATASLVITAGLLVLYLLLAIVGGM